jgi:hypothetical protein
LKRIDESIYPDNPSDLLQQGLLRRTPADVGESADNE